MTGHWAAGLLLTMVAGGLIGLLLAFFVLNLKTDEILAAIAINLMATGGLSKIIIPHCRHKIIIDDGLLLKGLWIIYTKNQQNP